MIILGIESTAHTFGIGLIEVKNDQLKILANFKDMYKPPSGWGIDPRKAQEHHFQISDELIKKSLEIAKPDLITYSAGPGLPPCLKVGLQKTKELAEKSNLPVIEVNHCIAHLEIGAKLSNFKDPAMLYVSGGNTQVIAFESGKYRVFGETQDIGIGNLLDAFGRKANLDFPAGPKIEALAKEGKYIPLPYSVKGMDVNFSGIKTKLEKMIGKEKIEDLCYSLQETCFAMLVEITERAMAHCQKKELILTGGVAANKRLQEMCEIMCKEREAKFFPVPLDLAGDQGVMIAWAGYLNRERAHQNYDSLDIYPRWRTDEVNINYR